MKVRTSSTSTSAGATCSSVPFPMGTLCATALWCVHAALDNTAASHQANARLSSMWSTDPVSVVRCAGIHGPAAPDAACSEAGRRCCRCGCGEPAQDAGPQHAAVARRWPAAAAAAAGRVCADALSSNTSLQDLHVWRAASLLVGEPAVNEDPHIGWLQLLSSMTVSLPVGVHFKITMWSTASRRNL